MGTVDKFRISQYWNIYVIPEKMPGPQLVLKITIITLSFACLFTTAKNDTDCGLDFKCNSTTKCISQSNLCDGVADCSDRSDESFDVCGHLQCSNNRFQCSYGACISIAKVCDLKNDCADGSDESSCDREKPIKCPKYHIGCHSNNECIWYFQKCDGVRDCSDSSDETYQACYGTTCGSGSFQCNYGACVSEKDRCNGIVNCADRSDEIDCVSENEIANIAPDPCGMPDAVKCHSGLCISQSELCNGIRDCDDGSDETYKKCGNITCQVDGIQCDYGACISVDNITCSHCVDNSYAKQSCFLEMAIENQAVTSSRLNFEEERGEDCIIPPSPMNGSVQQADGTKTVPGKVANPWTVLVFECDDDLVVKGESVIVCLGAQWNHPPPTCSAKCPPLKSSKHVITCTHNDEEIACDEAFAGLVANVKCKESFSIQNLVLQPYNAIQCNESGQWSQDLFSCEPDCGMETAHAQPLVINGYKAEIGQAPWHAGIYDRYKGKYSQMCGGTIISEKIIVSAAHCFWNYQSRNPTINSEKYAVGVGKFYRDWNNPKDVHAQYFQVNKIVFPDNFKAEANNFANDIAILVLNDTIEFNALVRPICLDWSETLGRVLLQPGAAGTVVGWGLTQEFGNPASTLQGVKLPFIELDQCYNNIPSTFKQFITEDKICAGYTNGTSVCKGDSGGGFALRKSNRYFLQGIISVAPAHAIGNTCDSSKYVALTNIERHLDWLKNQI